jgi:DNA-binding SARP family transcriptional activator/predicted ATPase
VRLTLTLLGGFEARPASGASLKLPTRKAQALLAYLATPPGRSHSREKLAALLWGDRSDGQARDGLRHALLVLRRALAEGPASVLRIERQTVALDPAGVDVDVADFEARVAHGTPEALEQAADLYRGDFLFGLGVDEPLFEEWLVAERTRLQELAIETLGRLLAHQTGEPSTERAIQTALRLLALDPLREPVHRALMGLFARQGRRGAALKQYQACVAALERQLGIEPEAATKALYRDLLRRPAEEAVAPIVRPELPARARPGPARTPDLPAADTPLLGRKEELGRLRQLLDEARRGQGFVATVVGEAGIGKTRLVSTLAAEALGLGCRVLVGRCHESDSILPFGPWVDACRSGGVSADEELLGALHPARRAELTRLFPEAGIGDLPPPSDSPLPLFESVAELVSRVAAREPLVLVLEDIHWADEMTLRLLAFVNRRLAAWPVLLLVTAREEELAAASMARHTLEDLGRETAATTVALLPLSRADTRSLVRALAALDDTRPLAEVEERVWAMSEGNPFVALEAIRALTRNPSAGIASGRPGGWPLPGRVRDLVVRRLDQLSPRSQQVAAGAAAIGRAFDFALLQAISGLDERDAAETVEELVRHSVLQAMGDQLDFSHDRVRDVVYGRLLPPRRRVLHRLVAEALEASDAGGSDAEGAPARDRRPDHVEQIAHHYTEAGLTAPAVAYWRRASERSSTRSAYVEAVAQCRKALELLHTLPVTAERIQDELLLQTTLGPALMAIKGPATPEAETAFNRALELSHQIGDTPRLFAALVGLWQFYLVRAQHGTARELAERLVGLARELGDPVHLVQAHRALGESCQNLGELVPALEHLAQGSALYDSQHHRSRTLTEPGAFCLAFSSWVLWPLGYPEQALAKSEAALALARQLGFPHTLAASLFFAAMVNRFRGERDLAQERAEAAIALGREHGLPHWTLFGAIVRGWALAMQGRFEDGIAAIREGLAIQQAAGARIVRPSFLGMLAEAHAAAGQIEAGLGVLAEALALVEQTGERYQEAELHRLRGALLLEPSVADASEAEAAFEQALIVARWQQAKSWELRAATSLARLWTRQGKNAAACGVLAPVYGWFREGFDRPDLLAARALLQGPRVAPGG